MWIAALVLEHSLVLCARERTLTRCADYADLSSGKK